MAHFHYHGPLPTNSPLLVSRRNELDEIVQLCLRPLKCYVIITGARQVGKTTFLRQLRDVISRHLPVVLVNLQVVPGASSAVLFRFLATELVTQLELESLTPLAEDVNSGPKLERFLSQLPVDVRRIVILVDEINALPEKTAAHMVNVLRAVFSNHWVSGSEGLGRVMFIVTEGVEPLNVTSTPLAPLVNIARRVSLPDLTLSEVKQLLAYGFAGSDLKAGLLQELASAIYEQTHGHPYLTQRVAAWIADEAERDGSTPDPSQVSGASDALLIEDENMRYVRSVLAEPAALNSAFQTLQERTPMRSLSPHQERLYQLGIIRDQDGVAVPRNALYARAMHELGRERGISQDEALSETGAPRVKVELLTSIIPTAYCHNLTANEFPLVQIAVDNSGPAGRDAQVYVRAYIERFTDEAVTSITVPRGQRSEIRLLPTLQLGACMTLTEVRPATLRVTVRQFGAGRELLLTDQTYPVHLQSYDTALLGIQTSDGSIVDLTDHLCAFVTPHLPDIETWLRKAADYHPQRRIVGYQGAKTIEEGRLVVREQVKAVFQVLKNDAGLVYVNAPLSLGKQRGHITQRVRLPLTSLNKDKSRANCIDGAVLYASLLELAGIDPLLAIVPGHAFVGWRIWQDVDDYEFLETTMTGTETFETAWQAGQKQYAQARDRGFFGRPLFDRAGFARLIDVAQCRLRHTYPLL